MGQWQGFNLVTFFQIDYYYIYMLKRKGTGRCFTK